MNEKHLWNSWNSILHKYDSLIKSILRARRQLIEGKIKRSLFPRNWNWVFILVTRKSLFFHLFFNLKSLEKKILFGILVTFWESIFSAHSITYSWLTTVWLMENGKLFSFHLESSYSQFHSRFEKWHDAGILW